MRSFLFLLLCCVLTPNSSAQGKPALETEIPAAVVQEALPRLSRSLQELAIKVGPALVQIYSTSYAPVEGGLLPSASRLDRQHSTGSGVIVDPQGYIVTNAHVVHRARKIEVLLASLNSEEVPGRSILRPRGELLPAELLGVDEETDLAVLKVEDSSSLTSLPFGNSEELNPGELVLALGSPFGLANSVTLGIVSATARQLLPEDPMIYIQTDAPINPGNSGGPLINMKGELVGINTMIVSQSGGSEGVGFAAPSNIVKHVYSHIREFGRVRRGEIGVYAQTVNPQMAQGLGLGQNWGVVVGDVEPGSPADLAGLRIGDLVLSVEGKPMENGRQFDVNLYQKRAGEKVRLLIARASQRIEVDVPVRERKEEKDNFLNLARPEENLLPELGIMALDIDHKVSQMLPPPRKLGGVVVAARTAHLAPEGRGLLPGDVIHQVNGRGVSDLKSLRFLLQEAEPDTPLVFQVQRGEGLLFVTVTLN